MGLPLDGLTLSQTVDHLVRESAVGHGGYLMTPNLDNLYALTREPTLMDLALSAELRVADAACPWCGRVGSSGCPRCPAGWPARI